MSLRFQLLALGALTLFLPWAGLEMVKQVELSLRAGLESSLLASARAHVVATGLADSDALRQRGRPELSPSLFVHSLARPPLLDGFSADWQYARDSSATAAASRAEVFADGSRFWLGVNSSFLYVYVRVVDDDLVYQRIPGAAPHGDRVAVVFGANPAQRGRLLLVNSAPGPFRAQTTTGDSDFAATGRYEDRVQGAWQKTDDGYAIEARLPLSLIDGALGIGIIDSDAGGATARLAAWTWGLDEAPNALVLESSELNRILRPFAGSGDRLRIIDDEGWVLADSGPLAPATETEPGATVPIVERFFRYVLRRDDPEYSTQATRPARIGDPELLGALAGEAATAWYRRGSDVSAIVTAAIPIDPDDLRLGALLLEQASDPIVTTTNQAMMQVMGTAVIIILIGSLAVLAYASLLSFRVGRLARAAESALGPRGEIRTKFPGTRGKDEIGDLARSFESLLGRLRDYTDYLQSLKSKLSHELRTPLAVVATSLENLEQDQGGQRNREYLDRLRQGATRLESVLLAMTAATRVEQAITETAIERFDINAVIGSCLAAYADIYASCSFSANLPEHPVTIEGSADLIAQMLDKLIDNAVGFADPGSAIEVGLTSEHRRAQLTVVNRGPLLPESMRHQLFDSLVSVRAGKSDKPHLGLGLYIVLLIAEFHRGSVAAENLADGSGVRFSVELPCSDAGAA